jgi:hypothetical protein
MINKSLPPAGTSTALRAGLAIVHDRREIATAWSRYRRDLVRHTSVARKALLRARTLNEILEVRAEWLRGTAQSFDDKIVRIAETASRTATHPHDAQKDATTAG